MVIKINRLIIRCQRSKSKICLIIVLLIKVITDHETVTEMACIEKSYSG